MAKSKIWVQNIQELPAKPGIYIICFEKGNLSSALYVGQSCNIRKRVNNNHPAYRKAIAEYGNIHINWELISDASQRNYRESFLIGQLEPEYNFGGSKTVTDNHGFPNDTWQIVTPDFVSNLGDAGSDAVKLSYLWLNQTWEYKQHAILFEYLNKDEKFITLKTLSHLAISVASRHLTKKCEYNKHYDEKLDSELESMFDNLPYSRHITLLYTTSLNQHTHNVKPFFMFGHIHDWIYSDQIDRVVESLLLFQGLTLPTSKLLISNITNRKVYHFLNKNLIDWDYEHFIKEGFKWLKDQRQQSTNDLDAELISCDADIEQIRGKMITKEIWEQHTPYDFWHQVIFWSLVKNEPYILLPTCMLKDWYNYNVLEYVYRNKHQVESYYNHYISSKDFVIAFYFWCLDNNKIPEINFNGREDDKKVAQSRVRIGK